MICDLPMTGGEVLQSVLVSPLMLCKQDAKMIVHGSVGSASVQVEGIAAQWLFNFVPQQPLWKKIKLMDMYSTFICVSSAATNYSIEEVQGKKAGIAERWCGEMSENLKVWKEKKFSTIGNFLTQTTVTESKSRFWRYGEGGRLRRKDSDL